MDDRQHDPARKVVVRTGIGAMSRIRPGLLKKAIASRLACFDSIAISGLAELGRNRSRPLKKASAKSAWRMSGDAGHRRMSRVSGRRGLPSQQLEVVCRGSHGELLGCSGEASQLKRS